MTEDLSTLRFVHDERFVEPFANRPHTVLGKRLFPFSLWTQFNLEIAQSPFLLGNRTPNLHDLYVAVQCASTPWTPAHYVPDIGVPRLNGWRGLKWVLRMRRYSYRMELSKFYAYLNDFAGGPKYWTNEHEEGNYSEAAKDLDGTLEMATSAEHEFGWEPGVVWTMPLGQLRWRLAVINRMKGSTARILTPMDEALDAKIRAEVEIQIKERVGALQKKNPKLTAEAAEKQARDEHAARRRETYRQLAGLGSVPTPPRGEPI